MSANLILEYAGALIRFDAAGAPEIVTEDEATAFTCESDAWLAALEAHLSITQCRVVNLYERRLALVSHRQSASLN